jgi:lipopolysaccharide export system protein LptA
MNDEIVGGLVVYDNTTDVYTVDGGAGQGGSGGRVSAILSPKATPVAAPAAAPQSNLRQSTTLGGEKK